MIVYFTFAFATNLNPRNLIDWIRNKWEMHGRGKLMVKDLQSHKSKVAFVLYFVFTGTPHKFILRTLRSILQEAADMHLEGTMTAEDGEEQPITIILEIAIRAQVPRLKGVDTKDFDKLPWHIKENRKALHVEAKPEDMQELRELVQLAKECGIMALCLGKRAHISKVMDNNSTPGEIKRMVKFAMKHTNYQGSMTGKTITGIALLDGEVLPTAGGGAVSLRMVMLNYLKMKDKFSLFAKLHQTEELGPVLAIIPACSEAKTIVHMMINQVAAFLYYFLKDAALPVKFIMDLLRATCDATLVAEIKDCDWDLDTQTLTTPQEKKEDKGIDELKNAEWYKNAFDLQSLGKTTKPTANKDPEALFDLDANNSIKLIHNWHLKPTFTLKMDKDDESEAAAPAATARSATLPRKNPNKEAMSINDSVAEASPPQDEEVGDKHAAGGG